MTLTFVCLPKWLSPEQGLGIILGFGAVFRACLAAQSRVHRLFNAVEDTYQSWNDFGGFIVIASISEKLKCAQLCSPKGDLFPSKMASRTQTLRDRQIGLSNLLTAPPVILTTFSVHRKNTEPQS